MADVSVQNRKLQFKNRNFAYTDGQTQAFTSKLVKEGKQTHSLTHKNYLNDQNVKINNLIIIFAYTL